MATSSGRLLFVGVIIAVALGTSEGLLRRCFTCRSRGDLGTCKDPFTQNGTNIEEARRVLAAPCASGWCGKILEGGNTFKDDDYGVATQRLCLQRSPSDNEERCASTMYNYKKVYMCFCLGDLCNDSIINYASVKLLSVCILMTCLVGKFIT